jgi:hypothetical protein
VKLTAENRTYLSELAANLTMLDVPPAEKEGAPRAAVELPRKTHGLRLQLDGILWHLTCQHHHLHHRRIVTVTAKSIAKGFYLENAAEPTYLGHFRSLDAPGQWVCWDFHARRVRLTQYTIAAALLKSWVLEGSLDRENWSEIDRHTDTRDFEQASRNAVSFAVANQLESRFIRLTQTGKQHSHLSKEGDVLHFEAVEFFGTLFE